MTFIMRAIYHPSFFLVVFFSALPSFLFLLCTFCSCNEDCGCFYSLNNAYMLRVIWQKHLCSGNPWGDTNWWRSMRIQLVMRELGPFVRGGVVGIGVKEQDRKKKKREGHSRSLKTSHQHSFKKMFQNDIGLLSSVFRKRTEKRSLYNIHTHMCLQIKTHIHI